MADFNGEFPTVIGADATFKGDLSFEKGVRIEGTFDGQIKSKGTLHVAEGARVTANIEASNVRVDGECKGNLSVSDKLHLMATAKMEGDLRTNRLEIADGAIFVGNVVVGQAAAQQPAVRRPAAHVAGAPHAVTPARDAAKPPQPQPQAQPPRPRTGEMRITAGS